MQKYISNIVAVWLILGSTLAFAKQDDNSKTANICQGEIENCIVGNVSVGRAGDRFSFNTTGAPVEPLGRITKTRQLEITITSGLKIMAFTPTEGSQREKQIKVLFYAFDINNMPQGLSNPHIYQEATDGKTKFPWAKTMLKVYRQLPGDDQWTEIIASFSDDAFDKMKPITVYIYPDARAKIYSPAHKDEKGSPVAASFMTADLTKMF